MAKLTLTDLANLQNETSAVNIINNNMAAIEAAIENTFSLDGTEPNALESDLDVNSNAVLNLRLPVELTEPVRKQEFDELVEDTVGVVAEVQALRDEAEGFRDEAEGFVGAAETFATAAEVSADEAADAIYDVYLGPFASDPTENNDGGALTAGLLYFNTTSDALKVYDGAAWISYSAATGLTEVADDTSPTLGGNLDVGAFTVGAATAADLTKLNALTATSAELNFVDGVTSAIQTQIDGKQPLDADLTAIAALTTTAAGRSALTLTDANADRILFWDDSAGSVTNLAPGNALAITGTTLDCEVASQTADGVVELATAGEYRTGTDTGRVPAVDQIWSAAGMVSLTSAAGITVDFAAGINFTLTLAHSTNFNNPSNVKPGQSGCIIITQDGTGSRTATWSGNWEFGGGSAPVLSTAAGAKDVVFYFCQSSSSIIITGVLKAVA